MAVSASDLGEVAQRYVAALFDLADEGRAVDQVAGEMAALDQMLIDSEDLTRLIRSVRFDREQQAKAIVEVAAAAGFSDITRKFLGVVASNRRLMAVPMMVKGFLAEVARRRGEETADVTSAVALSDEQVNQLRETLAKSTGQKISLNVTVDPDILGGLVVKLGSRLIDSSVRTKLQRLQIAMRGVA